MTVPGHHLTRECRCKALVLLAFLIFHVVFSLLFVAPGHLSIDEGVYDLMARDFSATRSLWIGNGYEEFASPELALPMLTVHEGTLVPQYPSVYTLLASPFYWLAGYRGLFLLNAAAFILAAGTCFLIAHRLFRDLNLSLNACLILVFATFAWEYTQAAWPHALTMLLVALAVYWTIVALQASRLRSELSLALLAGLTLGTGVGVRLDTIFALPAVLLPFLFVHPWRPRAGLAVCVGLLPGLAVLAATNHVKFGTLSPFSYGVSGADGAASGMTAYLPVVASGLVVVIGAWVATRPWGRRLIESKGSAVALGATILCALVLLTPQGWSLTAKVASGAYQLLIDLRVRDLAIEEGGLTRGPGGGMVYLSSLKKSLLQSCPYLIALVLPLIGLVRGKDVRALGLLFLVPAAFVFVYSYFAWHGGLAFNLRYFVPALPFLAILTAYAWRDAASDFNRTWARVAIAGGLAVFVIHYLAAYPRPVPIAAQETVFLTVPLAIAFVLGGLLLVSRGTAEARGRALRGAASATMIVALVWGGMVSLTYDFPRSYFIRKSRAEFSKIVAPLIEPNSILFVQYGDQFFGLIERGDVRFAMPYLDNYESFRSLIDFHLDSSRAVYLWRASEIAETLENRPLLEGLSEVTLYEQRNGALSKLLRAGQVRR